MKTVYVGLSGGVDSSVAAALLQQQGYRVVGIFMQNWTQPVAGIECPWKQDLADAKAVAATLDISFKVFDFQKDYQQKVVDIMVAEYQAGRTPNPDVLCNQEIKFKLFLETALTDGADLIATGHYARVKDGQLLAGVDASKDQSYFLYRVTTEALNKSLMPIGELKKTEVRQLAKKFGLPTASKQDSQGICFIGEVGIQDFLRQYVKAKPGAIIDQGGKEIGQHEGAVFYTIGQRQGLGVGGDGPYFVTGKDMANNLVYVTNRADDLSLSGDQFGLTDSHWLNEAPDLSKTYQARVRYRAELISCRLEKSKKGYQVKLSKPERAIAPGQSAVIYDGEQVLGGGIIVHQSKEPKLANVLSASIK